MAVVADKIIRAFELVPKDELLAIALDIQKELASDSQGIRLKAGQEVVTRADHLLQEQIFDYFQEALDGVPFQVLAEETHDISPVKDAHGYLIVDPLDGTSAFARGEETWGVMIGWVDASGKLTVSYNLLSSGDVYTSLAPNLPLPPKLSSGLCCVDVWDYGAGACEEFAVKLSSVSGGQIKAGEVQVTSYPAAVWAGWQLYQGALHGLVWLPSEKGKKSYPEYDLVMLGALASAGWQVSLGRSKDGKVQSVLVACNSDFLALLKDVAVSFISRSAVISNEELVFESQSPVALLLPESLKQCLSP